MRTASALAVAFAAVLFGGCMMVIADVPDAGPDPPGRDGGDSGPVGFGDGGDGGDSGDGAPRIRYGTGKDGDNGTALLVLLRVDQGTANLSDPVVSLVQDVIASLEKSDFTVTSAAVADLYVDNGILWASRPNQSVPSLADTLRSASSPLTTAAAAPDRCSTAALIADGPLLQNWSVNRIAPFVPAPGALLVILIETGARPQPLSGCVSQSLWSETAQWAMAGRMAHREQTHFLLLATPEAATLDAMRAHCMTVPGFPTAALDALAPSANAFFDPMAAAMNAASAGLATRVDLCDALGTQAVSTWDDLGQRWRARLELLR